MSGYLLEDGSGVLLLESGGGILLLEVAVPALYAAKGGSSNSNLYKLNSVTGVETSVGAIGFAVTGLAFNPTNGQLYGATSNSSPSHPKALISINKSTGAGTLIGDFGTTNPITDLAFASDGTLYGIEWASPSKLYTINKSTGVPTLVGNTGVNTGAAALAIDSADKAYALMGGTAQLWRVDLDTAAATSMAAVSPTYSPAQPAAAAVSSLDRTLWFVSLNSGTSKLYTTDPDGATTLVASLANNFDALAWDGTLGTFEEFVLEPMGTGQRVGIAMDSLLANEVDVVWTYIDQIPNLVAGIDIRRGRQTEVDQTETSTASVYLNDTDGLFDPDNSSSPYFGSIDGKQIILQCWNPMTAEWVMQYRGVIDGYSYDFSGAVNAAGEPLVATISIECVDAFDYLGGIEMIPGLFGDTPPAGSEGVVFYEDTDFQTRLVQLAADAQFPAGRTQFFTGNVDVQETKYDAGDSLLAAMRDVVDAEFPFLANLFTNKRGDVCAHGRKARFTPETVASGTDWNFTRWKAGDGVAVALDPDRAQIRPPLTWSRARSRIFNAALAYPKFPVAGTGGGSFVEADIPGQIRTDATSIAAYGYRSWSALGLIILKGTTTGNDAKTECGLYGDYVKTNYKDPHTRVEALTIKAIDPNDPRAEATWAMLVGQDISDAVDLEHGYPGGVGISESFFIEGSEMTIRPLNPYHDMVEVTLNVSPDAYYATDVFV